MVVPRGDKEPPRISPPPLKADESTVQFPYSRKSLPANPLTGPEAASRAGRSSCKLPGGYLSLNRTNRIRSRGFRSRWTSASWETSNPCGTSSLHPWGSSSRIPGHSLADLRPRHPTCAQMPSHRFPPVPIPQQEPPAASSSSPPFPRLRRAECSPSTDRQIVMHIKTPEARICYAAFHQHQRFWGPIICLPIPPPGPGPDSLV